MFAYFKKRREKKRRKQTFQEYGSIVESYDLDGYGKVQFAQWEHPSMRPFPVTVKHIDFYKEFSSEGGLIIDIGAHIGDTTVPMALAVGKEGLVLGLEPNIYVFKILEENANLNKELTNIIPLPFAATQEDGDFVFNYSDASFCNGGYLSQIENQRHKHNYELKVQGKNFDKYLREHYAEWLPKLNLLKVDAEGFDKDILYNMSDIISEFKPNIMAECYKRLTKEERSDLYNSIAKHDYTVYLNDTDFFEDGFTNDSSRIKLSKDTMTIRKHFEIIAIPNK